jgi:hypothetical protein
MFSSILLWGNPGRNIIRKRRQDKAPANPPMDPAAVTPYLPTLPPARDAAQRLGPGRQRKHGVAVAWRVHRPDGAGETVLRDDRQTAMIVLSEGPSSFDDALIGGLDTKAGYTRTVTFKQKAARRVGSELAS